MRSREINLVLMLKVILLTLIMGLLTIIWGFLPWWLATSLIVMEVCWQGYKFYWQRKNPEVDEKTKFQEQLYLILNGMFFAVTLMMIDMRPREIAVFCVIWLISYFGGIILLFRTLEEQRDAWERKRFYATSQAAIDKVIADLADLGE